MAESIEDRIAQLERWSLRISELSDRMPHARAVVRFDDVLHLDELKVLHAIAQTKFDAFQAAAGPERAALEVEVQDVWAELAAAFERRRDRHPED
jgi:hypothetical protein